MEKITVLALNTLELLFKNYTYTIRTGLARGLRRRYGFGFKPRISLTAEERFLASRNLQGKTVFDVGAYVGIYTMFFARAVGKNGYVVAFEPNPRNREELTHNVGLNKFENVSIRPIGVGDRHQWMNLVYGPIYRSRGSLKKDNDRVTHPTPKGYESVKVEVYPLDSLVEDGEAPPPDFVKIDVEGFEMEVLRGMAKIIERSHPELFIEIHGEMSQEMVDFLLTRVYALHHIEADKRITSRHFEKLMGGHLSCT